MRQEFVCSRGPRPLFDLPTAEGFTILRTPCNVSDVSEIAAAIAAAVEEQGAATQEIARNVQQAATGTQEVTVNITGVRQAANETGAAATQVLGAAQELSKRSAQLTGEVQDFLASVRGVREEAPEHQGLGPVAGEERPFRNTGGRRCRRDSPPRTLGEQWQKGPPRPRRERRPGQGRDESDPASPLHFLPAIQLAL